jgi:predicted dinucleotide-binding enzyme
LRGKIVVDISNPLNTTYDGLVTPPDQSAAEVIRSLLPGEARVVKAFNTTFAPTLQEGNVAGQPLDVFVASDDDAAKETVVTMIRGSGMNTIDAGRLERERQLEALGLLGITLQGPLGTAFRSGWRLVLPQAA